MNGHGRVTRVSLIETSGTAEATVEFYDGSGTGGILLDSISLSAGQSTRDQYRHDQYPVTAGLYVNVVSGTLKGAVVVAFDGAEAWPGEPVVLVGPNQINVTEG